MMNVSWLAVRVFQPQSEYSLQNIQYLLNCVCIPYKAGRRKCGQQPVSKNQTKCVSQLKASSSIQFLSIVIGPCPETMNSLHQS
jgi:hypothetical protein